MTDWMTYWGSRAVCALLGHAWQRQRSGVEICDRIACRGRTIRPRSAR